MYTLSQTVISVGGGTVIFNFLIVLFLCFDNQHLLI